MIEADSINTPSPSSRRISGPLSSDQIDEFFHQGFLVVKKAQIATPEVEWCRDLLMSMIQRGIGRNDGRNFDLSARDGGVEGPSPQIFRPSLYANELTHWPYRKIGLAIAKQLLGPEASLDSDSAILKPGHKSGPTPWHQDEAYNDPRFYEEQVTIWIALFDTTVDNGAMTFIPGSHRLGILPHRLHGGSKQANSIECYEGFNPKDGVACPIPAGAMTIHHGRTLHGASSNRSDSDRLGYIFNYKTPPKPRTDLGVFSWNARVAKGVEKKRMKWLLRGGVFLEVLRFMSSGRDNRQYFFKQLWKILRR